MDKVLLDLAEKFGENKKIAELVGCSEKDMDILKEAIDSFIAKTLKGTPVRTFIIKLLQACYKIDPSFLTKKPTYDLLYLIFLSQEDIKQQFSLLKKSSQISSEFNMISNIPTEDFDRLLKLFALFGNILEKSQVVPAQELKEELSQWHKRNIYLDISSNKNKESQKEKSLKKTTIIILTVLGITGCLLLYIFLKNMLFNNPNR